MSEEDKQAGPQAIFFSQSRQRIVPQGSAVAGAAGDTLEGIPAGNGSTVPLPMGSLETRAQSSRNSRAVNIVKLAFFAWFGRWFVRYFEIDRSLRGEPNTPHISMFWLYLALGSLVPFVGVYLYASVWRRRVRGEPLDLQNWQTSASSMIRAATAGLLLAWAFAIVALFPGYGVKSIFIVAVSTVCPVALADALDGIF
ncbi:hypothetical protein LPJ66_002402 [Kickxella alabastrina]|uniref:Uncharacterized protein n=1 Tax=Kickxella alabastrina TaxID=61397 RepID=A0ACC1IQM8_9FUNG|nr:hypothetical protein LPJ66_002402 [Kickxella alabastrina]